MAAKWWAFIFTLHLTVFSESLLLLVFPHHCPCSVNTDSALNYAFYLALCSSHMFPISELDGMKFESLSSLIHCQMILMKQKVSSLTRLSKLTSYPFYNLINFSVFWHWLDKFSAFFGTSYCCSKIAVRLVWTHATGCNPSGAWDSKGHRWSNAWASRCKYGIDEPFFVAGC